MIISYVILFLIILWGMSWKKEDKNREYLSIQQTKSVQGIFVILVLFSHFSSYIDTSNVNALDRLFVSINGRIGQLMVVMFLFYSGYGIMEKIKSNEKQYMDNFFKHRFLPVYIRFIVSILLYLVLDVCLGYIHQYSSSEIIFAFVGWTSIGNSNWFMFATFVLYILVFICFKVLNNASTKRSLILLTFSVIAYIILFSVVVKRGAWWYNTILCFPFGMWISYYIDNIDKYVQKNIFKFIIACVVLFSGFYLIQDRVPYAYCFLALAVNALVILGTVKVRIGNKVLNFFGKHVFSIYILQRLSYILLGQIKMPVYLFFIISVSVTLVLAVLFDFCFGKGYKIIVNSRNIAFSERSRE